MAHLPVIFIPFCLLFLGALPCFTSGTTLEELQLQLNQLNKNYKTLEEKVAKLELALHVGNQSAGKISISRTCRETRAADPFLGSGMYWIDPDGQAVGDDPIYVYCDMTKGSTAVHHDSESPTDVGHCAGPGCYSKAVNYAASNRQMLALVELSAQCYQSIKYDCNNAPLELNGVSYAWWNDKYGIPQYYWAGSNNSVHTCQCGIDGTCVDPVAKCNCDAAAPVQLFDDGVVTNKEILPITMLNFGRTQLETSSGVHTLGPFECVGQVSVDRMPSSCEDLWKTGHKLNGLYSVVGVSTAESIYCDFSKLPHELGFQNWIGFIDIKSFPTHFYVRKLQNYFAQLYTPIPFEDEMVNVGGAMNLTAGIFTAPRTGKYFFSASGSTNFPASSYTLLFDIDLFKNGYTIGVSRTDSYSSSSNLKTFTLQAVVDLQREDEIWLAATLAAQGAFIFGYDYTHFNGFLLEEAISESLNAIYYTL
ncbi:uncharacterized protein LOC130694024 [Daphnia carinata]|uniref:uncharacterized protein LOC130694024 n=1 Tax=Daphnia carinata TaxID=120202 RepID=UPI0025795CFF|nr:uncharacterized protein LOC130694024 [Daphnia carinata]